MCRALFISLLISTLSAVDHYQGLPIKNIIIKTEDGDSESSESIVMRMQTRVGDNFDQALFDNDLKKLSNMYDWIDPRVCKEEDGAIIYLYITQHPVIKSFEIVGSSYRKRKILGTAGLKLGMKYSRDTFHKHLQKIRDFYVKNGHFDITLYHEVKNRSDKKGVDISINISEGQKGHIDRMIFRGFTGKEKKEIYDIVTIRKYSYLTSWLTGRGIIHEDEIERDTQSIINYIQGKGYVDANVEIYMKNLPNNRIALIIDLKRGNKYYLNDISFSGNSIFTTEELERSANLKCGDTFFSEKLSNAQQRIRELYTKSGYAHTCVDYIPMPLEDSDRYNVKFTIEESEKYHVGLVCISGNCNTSKNVIYNYLSLDPGEVFNSDRLKSTQNRLMSTGLFKNVNVYPLGEKNKRNQTKEYCDVVVEVEEAQTGNINLFAGINSTRNAFGGIDIVESNFDIKGLLGWLAFKPSSLRGGGQFFQIKGQVSLKESSIGISWLNPYINDTLWRIGFDLDYDLNNIVSKNYDVHTVNARLIASYPSSPYMLYGVKSRVKDAIISLSDDTPPLDDNEKLNSGIVTGIALNASYDSTNHIIHPSRGFRSYLEGEFATLMNRMDISNDFPFMKFSFINSFYHPIWSGGTLRLRGEFQFIHPLFNGSSRFLPISERFFLGGEATVRGFQPGRIGPIFANGQPTGGISSTLLSIECAQSILKQLDAFIFTDMGSISEEPWTIDNIKASYGFGVRLDIGRRLPFVMGMGFPINADRPDQVERFFFNLAGKF